MPRRRSPRVAVWFSLAVVVLGLCAGVARGEGFSRPLQESAASLHRSRLPPLPPCLKSRTSKFCFAPSQIRSAYEVDPLLKRGITGRGRTIAIVVSYGSPTIRADLHAFDQAFSLPDPQLDIRAPLGTRHPLHTGWEGETTLDVEWAHVMSPGARILLLTSPVDETEGVHGLPEFLALERYAVRQHADVISQSWAATEDTLLDKRGRAMVAQFHQLYESATKQGISIVDASGDDGAAGLDLSVRHLFPYRVVQWPASDPLVLAVGGTRLFLSSRGRSEVAWQGSGGGSSKLYSEPSYQRGLPLAAQRLLQGRRGLPDVAFNAGSPVVVYWRGRWGLAGGTSASTPQWAGLIALADSEAGHDLGSINAVLYRLAGSSRYHRDFNDITVGSIKDPPGTRKGPGALSAGPGWDAATGLGTPRAASLLPDLVRESQAHRPRCDRRPR